jgi:hypothetical protein
LPSALGAGSRFGRFLFVPLLADQLLLAGGFHEMDDDLFRRSLGDKGMFPLVWRRFREGGEIDFGIISACLPLYLASTAALTKLPRLSRIIRYCLEAGCNGADFTVWEEDREKREL